MREADERPLGDEEHGDADPGRDDRREGESRNDPDAVPEPPHNGDLNRAGDTGDEAEGHRERVPSRHARDASC